MDGLSAVRSFPEASIDRPPAISGRGTSCLVTLRKEAQMNLFKVILKIIFRITVEFVRKD